MLQISFLKVKFRSDIKGSNNTNEYNVIIRVPP